MSQVVGVRFKRAGKVYDFLAEETGLAVGDPVLVETARGMDVGEVVTRPRDVPEGPAAGELKRVLRRAHSADLDRVRANEEKASRALALCREKARARGLDMRPVDAEVAFEGNKVTIYFTSEGRVDFRELVREMAGALRARIEFRQIGVRDAAKMLGGLGACGRPLCCATFLTEFRPVSIRMAKEQHLALNPAKISGICGRLMCCLRYECNGCGASEDAAEEVPAKGAAAGGGAARACRAGNGGGCAKKPSKR